MTRSWLTLVPSDGVSAGARYAGRFLVGPQPENLVGQLALDDLAVRRDQEAVLIDAGIDRQAGDQTDVGSFRRLDGTDPAIVGDVHVAHLEPGPFAVESAGPQGAEPAFVGELGQRIGLIDDLAQLAAAEEILDGRRDALGIDERTRRHVGLFADRHAFLHGAAQLEEALAQLVGGQFVDGAQPAIAEVVDVVDRGRCRRAAAGCSGWH